MKQVPINRYFLFILIVVFFLVSDLQSKQIIFEDLGFPGNDVPIQAGTHQIFDAPEYREGQSVTYIDGWMKFRLFTTFNKGALWGMGQGHSLTFAVLGVIASIAVCVWLFVFGAAKSKWLTVAMAFVMSGTLGNMYDRLGWHGHKDLDGALIHGVRDFMYFSFGNFDWAIWNLADACLVTGAIMLIVQSFWSEEEEAENEVVPDASHVAESPSTDDAATENEVASEDGSQVASSSAAVLKPETT